MCEAPDTVAGEEEEQESSEEMAATDRLTRGLVKKKVKVKPKAKPVASKAKATASTASASQPALRQKGGSSAGESGETFALDGRTRIFKENLKKTFRSSVRNCCPQQFSKTSRKLVARSRRQKNEKSTRRCPSWFPKLQPNSKSLKQGRLGE